MTEKELLEKNAIYLIQIIKSVINKTTPPACPSDVDIAAVIKLAQKHKCFELLYAGREGWMTDAVREESEKLHKMNAFTDFTQQAELALLCDCFEEKSISHLPLKGSVLKNLYPASILREMGDLDILMDKTMVDEYVEVMESLGYSVESVNHGIHDVFFKKPVMNVELHRQLFDNRSDKAKRLSPYYANVLEHATLVDGKKYEYALSAEDNYAYILSHMFKHNENGGVGIRSVVDIWIYLQQYESSMNFDYINEQLKTLGLTNYEKDIRKLIQEWFAADSLDTLSEFSMFLVLSGAYGIVENREAKELAHLYHGGSLKLAKLKYLISITFPGEDFLHDFFPRAAHILVLRPFLWVAIWFIAIFTMGPYVRKRLSCIFYAKKDDIESGT